MLKFLMFSSMSALVAGGVYLHGPLRYGETYNRDLDSAYETVRAMPMPPTFKTMVAGVRGGDIKREFVDGKSLTWTFKSNGKEGAVFTVTFTPTGEPNRTYVSTSYERLEHAKLLYDASDSLLGDPQLFDQMARVTLREQVDAKLERRPFNKKLTMDVMSGWMMANMGKVQQNVGKTFDEVSKSMDEFDKAHRRAQSEAEDRRQLQGTDPLNPTGRGY